jgi:hypothetical protein
MGDEPELIPGIYIYCDRWCQRCAFTSRCLQFSIEADEQGRRGVLPSFDALNVQFWHEMGEALVHAMRLIREIAAKEGTLPDDLLKETGVTELTETLYRDARKHPSANAALLYTGMVSEWFATVGELPEAEELLLTHPPHPFEEPIEVIRHYHFFIYPKIVRAVEGSLAHQAAESEEVDVDASATAKVALIAIDRSIAAWSLLYGEYPAHEDRTLSILLHLDRLRRSLELLFPDARAFVRPGLDD